MVLLGRSSPSRAGSGSEGSPPSDLPLTRLTAASSDDCGSQMSWSQSRTTIENSFLNTNQRTSRPSNFSRVNHFESAIELAGSQRAAIVAEPHREFCRRESQQEISMERAS